MPSLSRTLLRHAGIAFATPTIALLLTGCCSSNDRYQTLEQISQEYETEAAGLELPRDTSWPESGVGAMLSADQDLTTTYFEAGFGRLAADTHYLCSWEKAYLEGGDKATALTMVQRFSELPAYRYSFDDVGQRLFDERLAAAAAGDDSGIALDVTLNCPTD